MKLYFQHSVNYITTGGKRREKEEIRKKKNVESLFLGDMFMNNFSFIVFSKFLQELCNTLIPGKNH